ncbi:MAG TPA: type II toxin-antitoxin system prevent-host-death family antitoxin [Gemmatimonadaceae bacterium]|nr:type II toxin-antitoxin system prevent-host-death family antitoxin [Gemmatimonadaceae bacterium]
MKSPPPKERGTGRAHDSDELHITMPAGEFKTKCLELMDRVRERGAVVTITKRGVPVCKVVPLDENSEPVFGSLAGTVLYFNDPLAPTGEKWEADE